MAGTKRCKVCGREYEYCRTNRPTDIFRWQDVACSPEHGAIYFAQIAESRGEPAMASMDSTLLSELDGDVSVDDVASDEDEEYEDFDDSEEDIAIEQ